EDLFVQRVSRDEVSPIERLFHLLLGRGRRHRQGERRPDRNPQPDHRLSSPRELAQASAEAMGGVHVPDFLRATRRTFPSRSGTSNPTPTSPKRSFNFARSRLRPSTK